MSTTDTALGAIEGSALVLSSGPPPWTPASLTGLVAWYKADAGVYNDAGSTLATNNQTVQQWNDQSGNGYNLSQATSGQRPTLLTAGYNSKPTIQFASASTARMATGVEAVAMTATTAHSWFFVGQFSSGGSSGRFGAYVGHGAASGSDFNDVKNVAPVMRNLGNTTWVCETNGGAQVTVVNFTEATNYRLGVVFDGVNLNLYQNNVSQGSGAYSQALGTPGTIMVGADLTVTSGVIQASSAPLNGIISEIVVTKTGLSSSDRNSLDTYFTNKWGT